jgi:hypothetical protein
MRNMIRVRERGTVVFSLSFCDSAPSLYWVDLHHIPHIDASGSYLLAEEFVEELFTWDEARQLRGYLERHYRDEGETVIEEVSLPIENCLDGRWRPSGRRRR